MDFEKDFELEISDFGVQKIYSLTWDHEYGGTVACVPAVNDGIVYFGCDNHYFYALDIETGKEIWNFRSMGCAGNYKPVIVGDIVFFGSYDGYLYALKKKTGKDIWKYKTSGKVVSGIAYSNGKVVFGSRDFNIYCLNMEGEEIWRIRTGGEVISTPSIKDGIAYIGSYDGYLYCIDVEKGKIVWRFRTGGAIGNMDPMNIYEDMVFFGSWDLNMYCVNRFTGQEIWRFRTGRGILSCGKVHKGVLYFGSRTDSLHAVNISNGSELWRVKTEHHTHASNISIYRDRIYFGGGEDDYKRGLVCCVDVDGKILWEFITNGPSWAGPNIINGMLFAGAWNGYFYRIDPDTGKEIWNFRTSGAPSKEKVIDHSEVALITIITGQGVTEEEREKNVSRDYSHVPELDIMDNVYITKNEYSSASETYKTDSYK